MKVDEQAILFPGWSVHFRVENWDNSQDVPYRLRLGNLSSFEGLIRKDPSYKDTIVVASMSCNSPATRNSPPAPPSSPTSRSTTPTSSSSPATKTIPTTKAPTAGSSLEYSLPKS